MEQPGITVQRRTSLHWASALKTEAFLPTDRAFRRLAHSLTGKWYHSEKKVFTKLAGTLGVDTIESVLRYHVVPGATITYRQALKANGAVLQTALKGATIKVKVEVLGRHPQGQ